LAGGEALVESARLLPHVGRLKNLTGLTVSLSAADEQNDLGLLEDVPHLQHVALHFPADQAVDVTPCRGTTS
jgi:hypothetical protein